MLVLFQETRLKVYQLTMILKYLSLLITYFNLISCTSYSVPNILRNNSDLITMKNLIKEHGGVYKFEGKSSLKEVITYEQLLALEEEFNNYTITHKDKLTVKNFYLYTRDYNDGSKYEILDPSNITSIKNSHFQTRQTYILIHGFLGNGLEPWVMTLKDKLLQKEDCNVISVDWPAGSRYYPSYSTATGKVPFVGNDTSILIEILMQRKGLLLELVHCIGHSLGAHICGFAAKPFEGRVGKISGLDPAGPYFHDKNSSKRLDKKDAIYVDVIHTNACDNGIYWMDCFGLNENIGHSDFYPNGGKHQPGCAKTKQLRGDFGCDHQMAYVYYIASLDFSQTTTYFLARPCTDWVLFEIGNCSCGKNAQYMGFNVNTEVVGTFYLETLAYEPYAVQDPDCSSHRQWNIFIIIGYVIVALFVLACSLSVLFLVIENIKRACCSPSPPDEEDPLLQQKNTQLYTFNRKSFGSE